MEQMERVERLGRVIEKLTPHLELKNIRQAMTKLQPVLVEQS